MQVKLPYGREKLTVTVDDDKLQDILVSRTDGYDAELSQEELVKEALANPEDSPRLSELAAGKNRITIITSDHTRPVPSKITMPLLLKEIRRGHPQAEITILIATGFHRPTTDSELREKFGDNIVDEEEIVVHDSRNTDSLTYVGTLPSGGELVLNEMVLNSDLLIAEGFIEPHFFAGYSGGRKSILPGIASKTTVLANHCAEFIDHPQARTGILEGNPLHKDMLYAAEKAGLDFIVNVVINSDKEIIKAVAGHYESAHLQGCNFLAGLAAVEKAPADIVITTNGGYPLDQNIYQSVKGMTAAEATCKEGGVIII
ncbi:MAG: nickel-dependent lactate racemase, partial [Halanaerobiales bacterium]